MLLQSRLKNFPEDNKNGNFLTWPGLNDQLLLNHLTPGIKTSLGHMDQERKILKPAK